MNIIYKIGFGLLLILALIGVYFIGKGVGEKGMKTA
jgi:hypothetical protein